MDETTELDEATARQLVVADQRASYPDMSEDEAIEHARNTVTERWLDDDDPVLAAAYRIVLAYF